MILNETPIRTSKNFNANNINIDIKELECLENPTTFNNRTIYIDSEKKTLLVNESFEDSERLNDLYEDGKLLISEITKDNFKLKYGISDESTGLSVAHANQPIRIVAKEDSVNTNVNIEFLFDEDNKTLIDKIEIYAEKNSNLNVIINYMPKLANGDFSELQKEEIEDETNEYPECDGSYFHNGIIKVCALDNANVNITVVNLLNDLSTNLINMENKLLESATLNYTIVDFGGKNSITNYYSDLHGNSSNNNVSAVYLGNNDQLFDLNYIAHCVGEKSNINIEVQGALNDNAIKHFKGTIDFKKGCKKSIGNENENCLLLSDKAKSLALPMLLCSEEDVEGNHSSSSGKADNKELFYLMSRGLSQKEAMKLLVKARFNKILESIHDSELKKQLDYYIDQKI